LDKIFPTPFSFKLRTNMNLRSVLASTCGVVLLTQFASPAGAVSLVDENFDSATSSYAPTTTIPSFTVTSGDVDVVGPTGAPLSDTVLYGGNGYGNYIDLNGSQAGTIKSNTFTFNAGDVVTLSFDYGANGNGRSADISLGSFNFNLTGVDQGSTFQNFTQTFTVGSTFSDALTFASTNLGTGGVVLDNIKLDAVAAVPEPEAFPGMLLFAGGALMLRRKQLARNTKTKSAS
jgi:hypothetical protein